VVGVVLLVVVLLLLLGGFVLAYNGLVRRRNRIREAWAQIDVELERRHDLIPNVVDTVKGYAAHERGTFEAVTEARAAAVTARASGNPDAMGSAEGALTQTLRTLFAVAESYPQLRASENFLSLQEQLTATEDKIAFARRYYNGSVRDFNTAIQSFPRNLFAGALGFKAFGYFSAEEDAREVPGVSFPGSLGPGAPPPGSAA
jgi:LemA protein